MIHRLLQRQEGQALIMLLAFMALAVPLVTGALGYASTLALDSRAKTGVLKSSYSSMGGIQHLTYRLVYEDGWAESLPLGLAVNYTIVLNGINVIVTVTKLQDPPPPPAVPGSVANRAYLITKSVYPTTAPASTPTTYIYTSLISNGTDTERTISNLTDDFPEGLTYVTGSTSGLTTADPSLVAGNLRWNPTSAEGTIAPFSSKNIQFQMQGSLAQGVYCNDIWVNPGGDKTRSGLTAKIVVGSPASNLCPGTAIKLTKTVSPAVVPADTLTTYTYTLTFTSDGTNSVNVSKIIDLLPAGFNYVPGSSQGLTAANPSIVLKNNGTQQELTWSANPIGTVAPGETRTQTFQTTGIATANDYYNEATATVSGLNYDLYTWPTARVQVLGVFQLSSTDNKTTTSTDAWLGNEGAILNNWSVSGN